MVLVDGYHLLCQSDNLASTTDFGELQQRLQSEGVQVNYFATCSVPGKPAIEDLGTALGAYINSLNVPQVDIVSHSMGGLIVRSYLEGKQDTPATYTPPADPKVRKWISIATPNFGALIPNAVSGFLPDVQARELTPGSQFLFDLNAWNQNRDDLRGVDTLGLIGNAGGIGPVAGTNDGTVAVTSASMSFAEPDQRTRVLPYCHGAGDLTSVLGLGCSAPPLAKIQSDNPLSWQIIDSFLSGTSDWSTIGHSPSQDKVLSQFGGVLTQTRNGNDQVTGSLQDQAFVANAPALGTYTVVISKPGPMIALIAPSAARVSTLSLAPRMWISIYGSNLSGSTIALNGQPITINYTSDHQLNVLLPDNVAGLTSLTVSNAQGKTSENVFVEAAVPAIFTLDGSGTGGAADIRTGDYISLFLTGLGANQVVPVVTLNGTPATVTYAGPAPGFPGLDQINFRLPDGLSSGTVVVTVGRHSSNAVTI